MKKVRRILDTVFLLVVLFNLFSWFILPDSVAIHFGRGGAPDNWASKGTHILLFIGLMAVLYVGFALSPKLLEGGIPSKYISLPNRDYWLLDKNRPEAIRRMAGLMYSFGIATGLLMLSASILSAAANLSDPIMLNEGIFLVFLFAYIGYTIWWIVRLLAAFRVPGTGSG